MGVKRVWINETGKCMATSITHFAINYHTYYFHAMPNNFIGCLIYLSTIKSRLNATRMSTTDRSIWWYDAASNREEEHYEILLSWCSYNFNGEKKAIIWPTTQKIMQNWRIDGFSAVYILSPLWNSCITLNEASSVATFNQLHAV